MTGETGMRIAVLGATGATGRLMVSAALARGLRVTALARDPGRVPASPGLTTVLADVNSPQSIADAVAGCDVLLSGLGAGRPNSGLPGGPPADGTRDAGILTVGARAVVASGVQRVLWLGALGTGPSAGPAGWLTRTLLALVMRSELPDKVTADATVLEGGGTVFHVGPMSDGPPAPGRRTLTLDELPRRLFPAGVTRATVATAMVDEAVLPRFPGQTVAVLAS